MAETRKTFQIRQPQDVRYSGHGSGGFTASLEWDAGLAARLNGNLARAQTYVDQTCIDRMEPETPFRSGVLREAATLGTVTGSRSGRAVHTVRQKAVLRTQKAVQMVRTHEEPAQGQHPEGGG